MLTGRRRFLQSAAALVAVLPLSRRLSGSSPISPSSPAPTAGLLFDPADVDRIRANLARPRLATVRAALLDIDFAADERFLRHELKLTDHVQHMSRARAMLERRALAFTLFGDPRQLALARLALERLLEYQRWDFFLEAGVHTIAIQRASEATIAVCCALDWLGDSLSPDLRAEAERQIATKGAPACYRTLYGMKYPDRVRGWALDPAENFPIAIDARRWPLILNATNLKVIPTCALGFAAVWLHGRHPEAAKWLELSRQSAQAFAVMFGSDGSYDEGVGYWGYTTLHLIMLAEALHRRLGIDDRQLINYPGTARFVLAMSMPTLGATARNPQETAAHNGVPKGAVDPRLDLVNFGDSGTGADVSPAPWIGRTASDPLAHHVAHEVGGIQHWQAALWFDPHARVQPPGPELHDLRFTNDWVVSRTGWAADDTVVALRSGGPANHEHADRNSVIFKAHGERLLHDPFRAAYDPRHPRWLLRQTEAHTAVLIDGRGHQYHDGREGVNSSWAWARITRFDTGAGWMIVTSDATEAYQLVNPAVARVERTLVFVKPDILVLFDRIDLTDTAAAVQVRYQVYNDDGHGAAEPAGSGFTVTRPHARLSAGIASLGPVAVRVARLDLPAEEGIYPFVEVTSATATRHEIVSALRAGPGARPVAPLRVERDADGWNVVGESPRAFTLRLVRNGDGPPVVHL